MVRAFPGFKRSSYCIQISTGAGAVAEMCSMTSVTVDRSKSLSRGSSVKFQVLTAPWPSNGSQRSSRRFMSNRPASFWPLLVAMMGAAAMAGEPVMPSG